MSRKLYSLKAELTAIRTICQYGEKRPGQYLLSKVNDNYFATELARSSFKRILHTMRRSGNVPDWNDLITDPGIDETIRESLEEVDIPAISDKKKVVSLVSRLNEYRKSRVLLDIGKMLDKTLNSSEAFNTDDTIKEIQDKLSGSVQSNAFKVLHIGENSNVDKHVERILSGSAVSYIPTGLQAFDEKNRGLIGGSLVLIAGETGGGKSALLGTLANNMGLNGAKVGFVPLEMTNDEVLQRDVARNTEVSLNDLIDPENRLSKKQRAAARDMYLSNSKRIERRGGRVSYFEFESDVSIEGVLSTLQPYDYDVVIIDYIGLLDGLAGEDQWRAMNNAVRYAKIWAKNTGTTVIIAAQLTKEGMLKYAKGMMDHANLAWTWQRDELFHTTGVAVVKQPKARQQSNHDFMLKFDFPKMTVRDVDENDIAAFEAGSKIRDKEGKRSKRWEKDDDGSSDWGGGSKKKRNHANDNDTVEPRRKKRANQIEI